MPGTKNELIEEVRALTGHSQSEIDDPKLKTFLSAAQSEIQSEIGTDLVFFGPDAQRASNRALLWLTALFTTLQSKGTENAEAFSIGELNYETSASSTIDTSEDDLWLDFFYKNLSNIGEGGGMGSVSTARPSRTYEYSTPDE